MRDEAMSAEGWLPRGRVLRHRVMCRHRCYTCYRLTMANTLRLSMQIMIIE
jgi:hypothetical protein